jgi:hypothetical protein
MREKDVRKRAGAGSMAGTSRKGKPEEQACRIIAHMFWFGKGGVGLLCRLLRMEPSQGQNSGSSPLGGTYLYGSKILTVDWE